MQYILTQEEKDALVPAIDLRKAKATIIHLRKLLVPEGSCVKDANGPRYCDDCIISNVRPHDLSRQMCDLPRDYSK